SAPGPEGWVGTEEDLLAVGELNIPADLTEDMRLHAQRLGGKALETFQRIAGS
ncbi:MAG: hypothetical protein JWL70_1438, partial [Acidimicrobiia bacterium]|nr:hypothetical protein [Acidimicrobiia bacterium]